MFQVAAWYASTHHATVYQIPIIDYHREEMSMNHCFKMSWILHSLTLILRTHVIDELSLTILFSGLPPISLISSTYIILSTSIMRVSLGVL